MKKVLFVCTGNYYRSRFAEIYFNFQSERRNSEWKAFSRGFDITNPQNVGFISPLVKVKLDELKIPLPIEVELPKLLKEDDFRKAQKIIALNDDEHRYLIRKYYSNWEHKILFWQIKDIYERDSDSSLKKLIENIDDFFVGLASSTKA